MSSLNTSSISNSRTFSFKNRTEEASEMWKPVQSQPFSNITILSRPKNLGGRLLLPIQKPTSISLSNTAPASLIQVTISSNTLAKTAHISQVEGKYVTKISAINNITWFAAEHVIDTEEASSDDPSSVTSVSWAMTASDAAVDDAAREWFRSSSLAKRRTYSHGSSIISVKTIQKRKERIMKGYHPLCQTVKDTIITYPYL